MQTTLRKTKSGYYAETYSQGVKSVIVRGKGGRWELAAPDNSRVGAYFKRIKGLTVADLKAIVSTIQRILKELENGTQDTDKGVRKGTEPSKRGGTR